MSNPIDKALGLNPLPVIQDDDALPAVIDETVSNDVETARDNIQDAIAVSQQAVQDMLNIAQQSQHPKAYESLNSILKTYADLSMGLVDLQMKKQRLQGKSGSDDSKKTVNNNLFVGSTADILKMLEGKQNDG